MQPFSQGLQRMRRPYERKLELEYGYTFTGWWWSRKSRRHGQFAYLVWPPVFYDVNSLPFEKLRPTWYYLCFLKKTCSKFKRIWEAILKLCLFPVYKSIKDAAINKRKLNLLVAEPHVVSDFKCMWRLLAEVSGSDRPTEMRNAAGPFANTFIPYESSSHVISAATICCRTVRVDLQAFLLISLFPSSPSHCL